MGRGDWRLENGEWSTGNSPCLPDCATPPTPPSRSSPHPPQSLQPPSRGRPRVGHAARGASPHPPSRSSPHPPQPLQPPSRGRPRVGHTARGASPHPPSRSSPIPPAAPAPVPGAAPSQEPPMWNRGSEQDTLEHCQLALPAQLCYNLLRPRHCSSGVPNSLVVY